VVVADFLEARFLAGGRQHRLRTISWRALMPLASATKIIGIKGEEFISEESTTTHGTAPTGSTRLKVANR
jgi:hypothetical protein